MFSFKKRQLEIQENKKSTLESEIEKLSRQIEDTEVQLTAARGELRGAEEKAKRATHDRELENEKIEHRVKIKEEKNALELEKEKAKLEVEKQKDIEVVKEEYRGKLESVLKDQIKNAQESHDKLMAHMPKIEAMFGNRDLKSNKDDGE